MLPPQDYAGSSWRFLPRTQRNYAREVGDGLQNSIVVATVGWISRNFPEAPITLSERQGDGNYDVVPDHPVTDLLAYPNPHYSDQLMWMATVVDWTIDGNAYWLKLRNAAGQPVRLYWIPHFMVEPVASQTDYISGYIYRPGTGEKILLPYEDVIHFRNGIDPNNIRKGRSPLASLLREIFTDDEAANFSASVLTNFGVPGVVVTPAVMPGSGYELEVDAQATKEEFMQRFGGDRRGEPMVLTAPMDVKVISWSPAEMDMKSLRRLPEERVSAVLGIPAVVVGLGAGLDHSTFANYKEAREAAYENQILPNQRLMCAELELQLVPDFEPDYRRYRVAHDLTNVRALMDNQNELTSRLETGLKGGWLTVSEVRSGLGFAVDQTHDVYLRDYRYAVVARDQGGAPTPPRINGGAAGNVNAQPPPATPPPTKTYRKAVRSGEGFGDRYRALRDDLEPALTKALDAFFDGQANRVAARIRLIGDAIKADDLLPPDEADKLTAVLRKGLEPMGPALDALLDEEMGALPKKGRGRKTAEETLATLEEILGERIGLEGEVITETTREGVARIVLAARESGVSSFALADRVRDLIPELYRGRGEAIARTELSTAQNLLAKDRYHRRGVTRVELLDGVGCGLTSHNDPDTANGSIRTLDELEAYPTSHPRCVRTPIPIVDE